MALRVKKFQKIIWDHYRQHERRALAIQLTVTPESELYCGGRDFGDVKRVKSVAGARIARAISWL